MPPSTREPIAAPVGARCSLHPDRPALLSCHRCGAFICEEDQRRVDSDLYCPACAARPDVDYLDAFRLKYWGVRDSWAWLFGFGALVDAVIVIAAVSSSEWAVAGIVALVAAVNAAFCIGLRWARYGPLALSFLLLVWSIVQVARSPTGEDIMTGVAAGALPSLISIGIFFDTRNRLFFKVPVSRRALQKSWNLYANNAVARQAFLLAFLGLIVPGVALIALVMSIVGLRRVDPGAHPPVGRKGQAIAGIVLSAAGVLLWGFALLPRFMPHR